MPKRSHDGETSANKKPASLIASLKANRMTPSGYQKVDVLDTLFHALRSAQVERAVACCTELDCDDVWTSILSFCVRESPNALAKTLHWNNNFRNNRPYNQIGAAQDLGNAVANICATEHDTEPFCSLLLSSSVDTLPTPKTPRDDAFVQLRDLFTFGDNCSIRPESILAHFWDSFQAMDVRQCAVAVLAFYKLQEEEGMECNMPGKNRLQITNVNKIMRHWLNEHLFKDMIRHMAKNPVSYFYVLMSACMAQTSFQTANKVSSHDHETAHALLLAVVEGIVLPNKLEPVQSCVGTCAAIFNIFKGVPPQSTVPTCTPIVMNEWTDDVQEVVQRRKLTVHRQLRHLRPLEQSVPELASALTPSQINMSHDLAQKYTNLIFFDEMVGHKEETQEECRTIYNRAISAASYTFDVRKPYVITRFLISDLGKRLSELYSKFA